MLSSLECSYGLSNLTIDKLTAKTPNAKRIVVRSGSKNLQNRVKNRKSNLKIDTEPIPTRISLKSTRSTKNSSILSSKNNFIKTKLASPSTKTRKNSSRLFTNGSNRSLRQNYSPKSVNVQYDKIEFPIKPTKALVLLKSELNSYEQGEILKYTEIYYVGSIGSKLRPKPEQDNYGFDDKHFDYLLVKNDHIAYRYEILNLIGKGSFGQVCECFDHKKKEKVALKIIKNKSKFHQQAAIEVKILHTIRESDMGDEKCIVRMKNYFSFRNHICITFELVSINLYEFLRLNNFQGISLSLIKCFVKQLLIALDHTRSLQIVHCDLKPENVLLVNPKKATIKLIDFGSSCFLPEKLHTYIQSRFYRAPEIILGVPYTCAIDVWSLGCIIVELVTGQPLWPGDCEKDQLLHIISYFGMPPPELMKNACRKSLFFEEDKLKTFKLSNGIALQPGSKNLQTVIKSNDKDFLDFLNMCFDWIPEKRLLPSDGLSHPWIIDSKFKKSTFLNKKIKYN